MDKGRDCADVDCTDKKAAKKCMKTCDMCPDVEEEEEEEEEDEEMAGKLSCNQYL